MVNPNPTNFTYAISNSFVGAKIKLLDGTFYINDINIPYENIKISGSTNTTINADKKGLIFTINQDYNVLENIMFVNGLASSNGGAIRWTGTNGLINNCIFKGNSISGTYGGALYISGSASYCTVKNSRFEKNSASNTGALWWQGQYGSLINCTFIGNSATNCHAAVFWSANDGNISRCNFIDGYSSNNDAGFGSNSNRINIEYCNFTNNRANSYGGALEIEGGSYFTISNCKFNNNYAGTLGGATYNVASNSVLINCTFNNNTARANNGGGAVYWTGSNGQVQKCNFNNNKVIAIDSNTFEGHGGAIYWTGGSSKGIQDSNFFNNSAYYGSAIYTTQNIAISNSMFLDNLANSSKIEYSINENNLTLSLKTFDNYINAIYATVNLNSFNNVTYWGVDGVMNSNSGGILKSEYAAGQNITVEVYNVYLDTFIKEVSDITDNNGVIRVNDFPISYYRIHAIHLQDKYYSYISQDFILDVRGNYHDLYNFLSDDSKTVFNSYANYNYDPLLDSEFKNGIPINRDITINKGIIDGQNASRIFNINTNKVIFNNMTFIDANNSDKGGAIYSTAELFINECLFLNNWAPQGANIYTTKECCVEKSGIINIYYNTTYCSEELFSIDSGNFIFNYNWWGSNTPNSLDNNPLQAKLHFSKVSTGRILGRDCYFYTLVCELVDNDGVKYNVTWLNLTYDFTYYNNNAVNIIYSNTHVTDWIGTLPLNTVNAKLFYYDLELSYPFILLQHIINKNSYVVFSHDYIFDENIDTGRIVLNGRNYNIDGNGYTLNGAHKCTNIMYTTYNQNNIHNINFINSKDYAVLIQANWQYGSIYNCTFYNNTGNYTLYMTILMISVYMTVNL